MDESSSFDLSAQNSALASVGAMGRAVMDHNQSVKDSFKTQFAIDKAEHSAAELKNEVKDFSESIGAAKGVYELKQQYNLARDTRLPGQSKLSRLFELQPELAAKNIRELKNRVTQTLTGNVGEERSIGGLEDARGVAALNEELGTSIPTGAEITDAVSGVASRVGTLGGEALGSIYGAGVKVADTGGQLMGQALTAASQARMGINQSQITSMIPKPQEESLDVKNYNSQFSEVKEAADDLKSGRITSDEFRTRTASAYGFNQEAPKRNDFTRNTSFEQQRFNDVTANREVTPEMAAENRANIGTATRRDASDFRKAVEAHEAAKTQVLAANARRTNRALQGGSDVEYGSKTSRPVTKGSGILYDTRQTPAPSPAESAVGPALPKDDNILSSEGFDDSVIEQMSERKFEAGRTLEGLIPGQGAKSTSAGFFSSMRFPEDDRPVPEVEGTDFEENTDNEEVQRGLQQLPDRRDPGGISVSSSGEGVPPVEGAFDDVAFADEGKEEEEGQDAGQEEEEGKEEDEGKEEEGQDAGQEEEAGQDASKEAGEVGEVGSDIKDLTASDRLAEGVLKFGSKAAAGLGVAGSVASLGSGLYTAGEDIFDKGYFSKLNTDQQLGNVSGVIGGALDAASLAVPLLAPLALGANIFSAVAKTMGEHQAGDPKLQDDQVKEETQEEKGPSAVQTLSSVGLISSAPVDIHQSISGTSSF
jgi:hypothetical protein